MYIKKSGKIEYKVIKSRDLKKLMNYFMETKETLDDENAIIKFIFEFEDGSSISSSKSNVFKEVKFKKIQSIYYSLSNYDLDKHINIRIDGNHLGYYEVESDNRDWVDSKYTQLEDI